jgi:MFS transporter, DHA2 family, multidrug resistance protein
MIGTEEIKSTKIDEEIPKARRREWIGLAVIALPCLLYSMDLTVLNLAVPQLTADLRPSSSQLLWIVDIYGFMVAGSLITMGTLGDRIGRRRLLMFGAGAFGLGSILAAFSNSAEMLMATRALLGIAGATLAPSTLSLIRNMFHDARQRTFAIGVWITSYSVGGAIGPFLGGLLLEYFWWGSVFLLSVPVMILLLVLGPILLPEFRDPNAGRLDLTSAAMSLGAVLLVIFGLKRIAENGLQWLPALSILAGLFVGVLFYRRQRILSDPLIDFRLFRVPAFTGSLLTYMLGCLVAFGAFIFMAQYLQLVLEMTPLTAGLYTIPWACAFVVGSMLTPIIVRYSRPGFVMAGGLFISAIGFAMLSRISLYPGVTIMIIGSVIYSLGLAPVFTLATDLIVGNAPPERAGSASAISETGAEFGGALGIAVLGSIGTAIYRNRILENLPAQIPFEVSKSAQNTLGAAVAEAAILPSQMADSLRHAARGAFVESLEFVALVSTVLVIISAVLCLVILRRVKRNDNSFAPE